MRRHPRRSIRDILLVHGAVELVATFTFTAAAALVAVAALVIGNPA